MNRWVHLAHAMILPTCGHIKIGQFHINIQISDFSLKTDVLVILNDTAHGPRKNKDVS